MTTSGNDVTLSSMAPIIYAAISSLMGIILLLVLREVGSIRKDMKEGLRELYSLHRECKDDLRDQFTTIEAHGFLKQTVDNISKDREIKWPRFYTHRHGKTGRVETD